jgi:serine/threonine-protein kinase
VLGQKIGNYKITSTIGAGGMGAVYRAVHESLGRSAAVKVLLPEISNSRDIVTRFFNEARSAASIRHPGIVEIYDFGFLPDGQAYIIMEFLEGETLTARIRRARVPHAHALQIVRSVARALHVAHEQGIIHRDIKPDNIFLVPDPEMPTGERIKLLDFGIAKLGGGGTEPGLTRTGAVMGTPLYMSPEQCRGAGAVDRRADLYALGCILYELLCGRPPFVAEGAGDLIARHLYFQPEPPRLFDPRIPPPYEGLVLTLLQKDPAYRPPTALALAEQIDRLAMPTVSSPMLPLPSGGVPAATPAPAATPTPTPTHSPMTTLGGATSSIAVPVPPRSRQTRLVVAGSIAAAAVVIAVALAVTGSEQDPGGGIAAAPRSEATVHGSSEPTVVAMPDAVAAAAQPPPAVDAVIAAPSSLAPSSSAPPPSASPSPAPPPSVSPSPATRSPTPSSPASPSPATRPPVPPIPASPSPAPPSSTPPSSAPSVTSKSKREGSPARPSDRPASSSSPTPSIAPPEVSSTCTRSSFDSVLQAKQSEEATVQAALIRLRKCQKVLAPDVYAELQQKLIAKL